MTNPWEPQLFYLKSVVPADTSEEMLLVDDRCPWNHHHQQVPGAVRVPGRGVDGSKHIGRGKLSAAYPLSLELKLGQAIAKAASALRRTLVSFGPRRN
jgi:hypothetical protein